MTSAKGDRTMEWLRRVWRGALAGLVVVAWTAAPCAAQNKPVKSDQQILIELEKSWNEALYHKDIGLIEGFLAEEFTAIYDDGTRVNKKQELELAAKFNQNVESAIQDDFSIKIYRDTAVVAFTLKVVGFKKGEPAEITLRYTDVFVMRDGRWQCVSSQSTRVKPS